jgi:hypothetical protein
MVRRTVVLSPPNTVIGRLVWALATVVVLALGFFLLTAGLVLALGLAAAAALRIWWHGRRVRQDSETRAGDMLEVEYTVEPDNPVVLPPGQGPR